MNRHYPLRKLITALVIAVSLTACSSLKENPFEAVTATIAIDTIVKDYSDARGAVEGLCSESECPRLYAGPDRIEDLLTINLPKTSDQIAGGYLQARTAYKLIRGEVGERFDDLTPENQTLLLKYDADLIELDRAITVIWRQNPDKPEILDKILSVASTAFRVAELYQAKA